MTIVRRLDNLERRNWIAAKRDLSVFTDNELERLAAFAERVKAAGPLAELTDVLTPDEYQELMALDVAYRERTKGQGA